MAKLGKPLMEFYWKYATDPDDYYERVYSKNGLFDKLKKKSRKSRLVGRLLQLPVENGIAWYLVTKEKPLTIAHVPIWEGCAIPPALLRKLTLKDVQMIIALEDRLYELFSTASMSYQPKGIDRYRNTDKK